MGQAPIGHVLFTEEMNFNPADPNWANRDRFVLSSGHGCMLQYSLLHLAGYDSVGLEDLKQFRQWGSKTPGHPENFETAGIEVTTGPLGMGISNAVGLAAAEAHMAAVYNKPDLPLIDHYTYCILGDGCMQEGISHESCAYAGHLGLGKLIAFYDDNGITIDGHTELSFTEDVGKRYEAYGWQVLTVEDGNTDVDGLRKAIAEAKACTDKPTLIKVKTTIGYGSPNKADSHDAHGSPLGADEAAATREQLGWTHGEFEVPESVYDIFHAHAAEGAKKQEAWTEMWGKYKEQEPELAAQFQRVVLDGSLPEGWVDSLPSATSEDNGKATRLHSQDCLNALASVLPELIGGSADLAPSNMTLMKCTGDFLKGNYAERNMRFGIREFGMGAVANAISLHKTGLVPYCATFTIFSDYMRNAIRLAALAQCGTIFVTTHDSIAVGEDASMPGPKVDDKTPPMGLLSQKQGEVWQHRVRTEMKALAEHMTQHYGKDGELLQWPEIERRPLPLQLPQERPGLAEGAHRALLAPARNAVGPRSEDPSLVGSTIGTRRWAGSYSLGHAHSNLGGPARHALGAQRLGAVRLESSRGTTPKTGSKGPVLRGCTPLLEVHRQSSSTPDLRAELDGQTSRQSRSAAGLPDELDVADGESRAELRSSRAVSVRTGLSRHSCSAAGLRGQLEGTGEETLEEMRSLRTASSRTGLSRTGSQRSRLSSVSRAALQEEVRRALSEILEGRDGG